MATYLRTYAQLSSTYSMNVCRIPEGGDEVPTAIATAYDKLHRGEGDDDVADEVLATAPPKRDG